MRVLVAALIIATACTPTVAEPSPSATASASTAAPVPRVSPTSAPTQAPTAVPPRTIAADASAGSFFFLDGGRYYRYDGGSGRVEPALNIAQLAPSREELRIVQQRTLFRITLDGGSEVAGPDITDQFQWADITPDGKSTAFISYRRLFVSYQGSPFGQVAGVETVDAVWSPDGRRLALTVGSCGTLGCTTKLWIYDAEARSLLPFFTPPHAIDYSDPTVPIGPLFSEGLSDVQWSPDGRYLVGLVENWIGRPERVDAALHDARELLVFDTLSARTWSLGPVLAVGRRLDAQEPWFVWGGDHALAYVAGDNASIWANKSLSLWTPEEGTRAIIPGAAYTPSWKSNGTELFFAWSPDGRENSPRSLSEGTAPLTTWLMRYDLSTRKVTQVELIERLLSVRAGRGGTVLVASGPRDKAAVAVTDGVRPIALVAYGQPYTMIGSALNAVVWDR